MKKEFDEIQRKNEEFDETTEKLITFYKSFNECFSKVYECFEVIDKKGGKDENAEQTKAILEKLQYFHSNCCNYTFINDDSGINLEFNNIEERIDNNSIKIVEINDELRRIQNVINDALTHDLNWGGQQCCVNIISKVLSILSNIQDSDIQLQKIVRTISELVFDCALAICVLQPLTKWNFGTENFSLLSSERQLVLLLNKAIVVDRMSLSLHSLGDMILRVNKLIDSFFVLNWKVYYVIGFLNYKIHKYENAKKYFKKVCEQKSINDKKEWFHSHLLIAYSYEYSGQFIKAIEQLALPPQKINSSLEKYECNQIRNKIEEILSEIIWLAIDEKDANLIKLNFTKESYLNNRIVFSADEEKKKRQIEVLHALAHCFNEFSIRKEKCDEKQSEESSINFPKFTFLARAIMEFIAGCESEYWTCYATIHGEYADYYQAITYLEDPNKKIMQETLLAERQFFRYYFKQMLGEDDEDDREKFKAYCAKYSDNDAQCHIKIFEFRTEFRKYFSDFFEKLGSISSEMESHEGIHDIVSIEIPQKLKEQYKELCVLKPTLYMNVNVRAELRKMQRAYRCLEALIEYIKDSNEHKHSVLVNACNRFCHTRSELDIDSDESKFEPTNIKDVFFAEKGSISYCLHNSDSIFLLAPISGVVVYQYQTGTIDTLFDVHSISEKSFQCEVNWEQLINNYTEDYIRSERPIVEGIDWNVMPTDVNSVFCWRENDQSNIIVVQKNNNCYIRKIVDSVSFRNRITQLIEKKQTSSYNCTKPGVNIGKPCLVSSNILVSSDIRVTCLEVVLDNLLNDTNNIMLNIFHRLENNELQCFIALSYSNINCHSFHKGVMRAFWKYEDKSDSDNSDNLIEQTNQKEIFQLVKKRLEEILKNMGVAIDLAKADMAEETLKRYNELLEKYKKFNTDRLSAEDEQTIVKDYPKIKDQFKNDFPSTTWSD